MLFIISAVMLYIQWTNFVLDLSTLINDIWKNQTFKSIDFISISANCKLRKLFTLKNMPNIEYGRYEDDLYINILKLSSLTC